MLSLLTALTTTPAVLAISESTSQATRRDRREAHRAQRCNLIVTVSPRHVSLPLASILDGRPVVLKDGRLIISTTTFPRPPPLSDSTGNPPYSSQAPFSNICANTTTSAKNDADTPMEKLHPAATYFLPYPSSDPPHEGLVTSITDATPPVMNWIYLDAETHEMRYGVRAEAEGNVTGPFDCTKGRERRLCLEGWEGWVVVWSGEEGEWRLGFDRADDGMRGVLEEEGARVVEVLVWRVERRRGKGEERM